MKNFVSRAAIEVGSIIFLFYANLLMGAYVHSGVGQTQGVLAALREIITAQNFTIAVIAGVIGHGGFELLRRKFR
jgi:hypothetical protein